MPGIQTEEALNLAGQDQFTRAVRHFEIVPRIADQRQRAHACGGRGRNAGRRSVRKHLARIDRTGPSGDSGSSNPARRRPCSPCFLRVCPIDLRCMTGISVEQVAEAVLAAVK